MAKRRRKLSKDYEKLVSKSQKEVELIIAKINDIDDDDIREEYSIAFASVKSKLDYIRTTYDSIGYNDDSDTLTKLYDHALKQFIQEYEI